MSDDVLDGRDVGRSIRAHHGIAVPDGRADAIAREVSGLVEPVRKALPNLPLEADPFGFAAVLSALKDQ